MAAFFDELRLGGFVEGQNLVTIAGGFDLRNEQANDLAVTMVNEAADVIYSGGVVATRAVQAATRTVPNVAISQDLVADGFVASFARPGGNTTGVSIMAHLLDGKRLEILLDAAPLARRVAILADSGTSAPGIVRMLENAARGRGVEPSVFAIARPDEIGPAMERAKAAGAEALHVLSSPLFGAYPNRTVVIGRATELRMPAIYEWPDMAQEGGFAAYGPRIIGIFRQAAGQAAAILRGARPADIPVEQPTRFDLVINLKAARAIGHTVPQGLVARADEVIES
jgi:putative ABC transport system substrate-binding protein